MSLRGPKWVELSCKQFGFEAWTQSVLYPYCMRLAFSCVYVNVDRVQWMQTTLAGWLKLYLTVTHGTFIMIDIFLFRSFLFLLAVSLSAKLLTVCVWKRIN